MKNIKIRNLSSVVNGRNLIDIRDRKEYQKGRIPRSINIPFDILIDKFDKLLNKRDTYYIVCEASARSIDVISYLSYYDYDLVLVVGGTELYDKIYGLR